MYKRLLLIFVLGFIPLAIAGETPNNQATHVTYTILDGHLIVDIPATWHFQEGIRVDWVAAASPRQAVLDNFFNISDGLSEAEAPLVIFNAERFNMMMHFSGFDPDNPNLRTLVLSQISANQDFEFVEGIRDEEQSVVLSGYDTTTAQQQLMLLIPAGNYLVSAAALIEADDSLLAQQVLDIFRSMEYHTQTIGGQIVWEVAINQPNATDITTNGRGNLLVGSRKTNRDDAPTAPPSVVEYDMSGQLVTTFDYNLTYLSASDNQVVGTARKQRDVLFGFTASGEVTFSVEVFPDGDIQDVTYDDQGNIWVLFYTSQVSQNELIAAQFDASGQMLRRLALSDHIDAVQASIFNARLAVTGNHLYVAIRDSIYLFNTDGQLIASELFQHEKLVSDRVTDIAASPSGDVLYFSVHTGYIVRHDLVNDISVASRSLRVLPNEEYLIALVALSDHEVVGVIENVFVEEAWLLRYDFDAPSD